MRITLYAVSAVLCVMISGSMGLLIPSYCTPMDKCYPSKKQIKEFGETLEGRVVLKNKKEYAEQSEMFNVYEQRSPYVIVMVKSEQDIRRAMIFTQTYNLRVAIRSSGHSYVGRSTADDSFVINLSEMREYEIRLKDKRHKDGVLITQTGITWGELFVALGNVDRIAVGASCLTVTPGGYTLGGGHGSTVQSFGYAADNLLGARVVLVDGSYATCTERKTVIERVDGRREVVNDGDLFWALKGGGGGTFGVIVTLMFRIHQAPKSLVVFQAALPLESNIYPGGDLKTEVFDAFSSAFPNLSAEWGGVWVVNNLESSQQSPFPFPYRGVLSIFLVKLAPWDGSEQTLFNDILSLSRLYNLPGGLMNMTSFVDFATALGAAAPTSVNSYNIGSFILPQFAGEQMSEWFNSHLFAPDQTLDFLCAGIPLGGATMTTRTDTPLHPDYRQAVAYLFCYIQLKGDEFDDDIIQQAGILAQSLKTLGNGEYFNEPTRNNEAWKEEYWGMTNYQRLLDIKCRYDPTNFLTCHHCVGSDDIP